MKRRYINILSLSVFVAMAVCCNKNDASRDDRSEFITLNPVTQDGSRTKGGLYQEGALSDDYTIYLSSYFVNETSERNSGNYFVSMPFNRRSDRWCADPAVYWPFGGYINFLAVACKDGDFDARSNISWNEEDSTKGAIIKVPSGDCMQSEILFSKASSRKASQKTVDLTFEHTQTWLQFSFSCEQDAMVRIENVVINNVYTGGLFAINNTLFMDGEWSFRGFFRHDESVPGAEDIAVSQSKVYCNMLLPEQDACNITFIYRQRIKEGQPWDEAPLSQYTYHADKTKWFYGIRNVFDVHFTLREMILSVTLADWDTQEKYISME